MNKKLIIYDLDGTLIDSRRDIAEAVNGTLREMGLAELPVDQIARFVGSGVKNLMQQALKEAGADTPRRCQAPKNKKVPGTLELAIKRFRAHYGKGLLVHTRLYPSVPKVLECLKNRKQAVITNKPEDLSLVILKGLGIESHFFTVIGGDGGFPKKPSPEAVREILRRGGAAPEESLLVGDSAIDIETARHAGIQAVGVTYGFGTREEIESAKPDGLISDLEELLTCPLL